MDVLEDASCAKVQADYGAGQMRNSKTADSGGKTVLEDPIMLSQLLNGYVDIEIIKNIRPQDITDVTNRFLPMFTEERDADVVKRVHIDSCGEKIDFFIALIEHKSGVDYNVVMQLLRYMTLIWEDFEKEQEKIHKGISKTKKFKYPPVLPIVYYEGRDKWTASLELPDGYLDEIQKKSPDEALAVIAKVIAVMLRKQNVPEDDISKMVDQIKRRKPMGLFDGWQGFDVQEERRNGGEIKVIQQVCAKISMGQDVAQIAKDLVEEESHIQSIYDVASKFAPNYDAEKIYEEMTKAKEKAKEEAADRNTAKEPAKV